MTVYVISRGDGMRVKQQGDEAKKVVWARASGSEWL